MAARAKSKQEQVSSGDAIDAQLERYRAMRDFSITVEPSGETHGAKGQEQGLPFVIQKHAASHLHYDFRLGWKGVLKSWAVAKGPSYFPGDKRLAVQVEDHPMEYGGFEGIIPKGQYGGGTVMLWDEGTWQPQPGHTDIDEGLRTGSLKFVMHGTKMKGKWALIRMGGKAANERKPNWLLIKEHDEFERAASDDAITEEAPASVVTGRSLEEIARNEDHVWNSKETASGNAWYRSGKEAATAAKPLARRTDTEKPSAGKPDYRKWLEKTPKEPLPPFIKPQLGVQSATPPTGAGWIHELKLDGYRIQGRKDGPNVQLLTRTGLDWTHRMKGLAASFAALPADSLITDGEVVVLTAEGTTSFAHLQAAFQGGTKEQLTYFLFDLLHLNGHDLRELPLLERKTLLARLLKTSPESIEFSEHLDHDGEAVFKSACKLGAEGVVSKRGAASYVSGRSGDWLKSKCIRQQEFVIGGFTLPSNGIHGIGALLLGYYDNRKLIYAGRTGTGFTQKTHRLLRDKLNGLRQKAMAFGTPPADGRRGVQWVKPELVAEVSFATWTADGLVRQAAFKGLREDKPADEVVREAPVAQPGQPGSQRKRDATSVPATAPPARATASREDKRKSGTEHAPVRLTHPSKTLDAESGLTKQLLADYYWAIAPYMLPQIAERPLSLVRCPEGTSSPCFFQKHANKMLPKGIQAVEVPDKKTGKPEFYITLSTAEALADLAQMGVLEVHPWGSRNDDLERPDRMVIDLDPDATVPWKTLAASARKVRKQLQTLGLESFLKTTGGKGLHIVLPLQPEYAWATIKEFAHAFASQMEKREPGLYLTKMSKAARVGRIFIDYLRNERGATAVAAYSPRARTGATVSLPVPWGELGAAELPTFRVTEFDEWKGRLKRDPWKTLPLCPQRITPAMLGSLRVSAPSTALK